MASVYKGPNIENIRKWVAALRSGKYLQTRGVLKDDTGYCCLGVATDVYLKETNQEWQSKTLVRDDTFGYTVADEGEALPQRVQDWLGIRESDPDLNVEDEDEHYAGELESATHLNDTSGWSFEQIANAIERTYLQ